MENATLFIKKKEFINWYFEYNGDRFVFLEEVIISMLYNSINISLETLIQNCDYIPIHLLDMDKQKFESGTIVYEDDDEENIVLSQHESIIFV